MNLRLADGSLSIIAHFFRHLMQTSIHRQSRDFLKTALLFILALGSVAHAQFGSQNYGLGEQAESDEPQVTAALISEHTTVSAGQTFTVAIELQHLDHWHSYWRNSGGISLPTEVQWKLPQGWTAGELQWPTAELIPTSGFNGYAYQDTVYLLTDITVAENATTGDATIKAIVDWQACKVQCIPGTSEPTLTLTVGDSAELNATATDTFIAARRALPSTSDAWEVSARQTATGFELILTPKDGAATELEGVQFFPYTNYINPQKPQTLTKSDDDWVLSLPTFTAEEAEKFENAAEEFPGTLHGDLAVNSSWLADGIQPNLLVKVTPGDAAAPPPPTLSLGLLGIAFLGGLILNLMPCVFPVIGLKIMGFVNQAGEDRKKIAMHGIIFTLGVLVSFWALVGALQILREVFDQDPTWGRQLQEPWFVLGLVILLFVFSLSLVGVMEIGIGATGVGGKLTRKSGLTGTFFSGVFATVVATPCAAPFLAPALGAAMALPVLPSFVAFTAIALGLALPYLILSAFPQLVELLPKPGAWMETFKQLMSFLLFATVAYLVWVFSTLFPDDNSHLRNLLFGLVVISLACYVYGRWSAPWRPKKTRVIGIIIAVLLLLGGSYLSWPTKHDYKVDWQTWSPEAVEESLADGHPVFVDFTASWCVTCLANKGRYEHNQEVVELMEQKGIVAFKADNTEERDDIARAMAAYGRAAVPVNLLFTPGNPKAEVLDETFGASYLLEKFSAFPNAE